MAYIPPHKRHSSCTPAPESHLLPRFRANSSGRNSSGRSTQKVKGSKIVYADAAISKWFAIGLLNTGNEAESSSKFSTLIGFEPVSADSLARKSGETPFALVLKGLSCLEKTFDLRLMLNTKRIMIALTNEELDCIRALISCAVLDSGIKGGLRWPLGKDSSGDRYTIAGVWHTTAKTYRSSSFRLKVRSADRFDFRTSSGEVSGEVVLKMHGIVSQLQKQTCDSDEVFQMLGDNLKLIWDHLLCSASSV